MGAIMTYLRELLHRVFPPLVDYRCEIDASLEKTYKAKHAVTLEGNSLVKALNDLSMPRPHHKG